MSLLLNFLNDIHNYSSYDCLFALSFSSIFLFICLYEPLRIGEYETHPISCFA